MKLKWFSSSVFTLFLGTLLLVSANAYGAPQGPRYGQDNDRGGWDAPPREFRDIQRQGFRDGIEGFRRDMDNHRRPDVNNRDEYRSPRVPYGARREYREGFRRGYNVAMRHSMGN
jgi:hypothetical protein